MKSILIIEDDPLVRKTLASQLAKKGFDVAVAETGEDGVRAYGESAPDLVLLDVRLPDIDGLEVLRKIKERNRRAIILIMTAFDDMKTTVEAIKLGAFEYLVKPLNSAELDLTIEKAFQVRALEEKVNYLIE
jgi:DNA-binding NtrC family response regulator